MEYIRFIIVNEHKRHEDGNESRVRVVHKSVGNEVDFVFIHDKSLVFLLVYQFIFGNPRHH